MDANDFIEANRDLLKDSRYEELFVREVLTRVPGIDFTAVRAQVPFRDGTGKRRRIDFTIEEGEHVRIALEVDGYNKRGFGSGMSHADFVDWSAREQAMTALGGYRVLRFANTLVKRSPEDCARNIELTLEAQRELSRRVSDAEGREQALAQQLHALGVELVAAQQAKEAGEVERLRRAITETDEESRAVAAESLGERERTELRSLEGERRRATEELEQELLGRIDVLTRETRGMKTIAVSIAAVAVAVAVAVALIVGSGDGSEPVSESPRPTPQPGESGSGGVTPVAASCEDSVSWRDAQDHLGTRQSVRGPVKGALYAAETKSRPTYLNLGRPFPEAGRFVAVIFGDDRRNFRRPPEDTYEGREIAVTGDVRRFRGVPQIIVNRPNDIKICSN